MPDTNATFAVRGARVFDGERFLAARDVHVRHGVIISAPPPDRTPAVDGAGCTLLPGLIDSHVHAWGPLERTLARYLLFGVTTALEMQCDADGLTEAHELRRTDLPHCAQMLSSGFPVTVPGGHGTEYGFSIPTVATADDVGAFVAARVAEGSDYIKIIFNDPERSARTLSVDMVRAAVEAAHAQGKAAIAHVNTAQAATKAIECGVDGLAHVFNDQAEAKFAEFLAESGAFVIPTLAVLQSTDGASTGRALSADARLSPFLTSFDRRQLGDDFPSFRKRLGIPQRQTPPGFAFENALATVQALNEVHVPLLAGTDAPNPGTTHGASIHHELSLLIDAGLTPAQALAAATSVPASRFGLADRGRIAAGLRADMLLVRGDVEADITATRDIVGVWKAGVRLEREGLQDA